MDQRKSDSGVMLSNPQGLSYPRHEVFVICASMYGDNFFIYIHGFHINCSNKLYYGFAYSEENIFYNLIYFNFVIVKDFF